MSWCPSGPPPARPTHSGVPDALAALVDDAAALADPQCEGPLAMLAVDHGDSLVVDRALPLSELTGLVAPAPVRAVVVVAGGRARRCPDGVDVDPDSDGEEVVLAWGADRSGASCGQLCIRGRWVTDGCHEGRVPDTVRRVLGLPTAPPPAGTGRVWAALWAASVWSLALDSPRPLSWTAVVAAHPFRAMMPGTRSPRWDLPGATRLLETSVGWPRLRYLVVEDLIPIVGCPPDLAGWMDDGMFARHVLDSLPPPEELFGACAPRLAPVARRRFALATGLSGP